MRGSSSKERVVVIGKAVGDFVDHLQPRLPQHVGAPQDEDGAPELLLVARQFDLVALMALARVEQRGDLQFARQGGLAPDLGRVGGEHRADQRVVEERAQRGSVDAGLGGALEGVGQRARTRLRLHPHMGAVAADMVLVLGDIGQVREIAEGAHDRSASGRRRGCRASPPARAARRSRCRGGSGSRLGECARRWRRPRRLPARARCRRAGARAGGCRRAAARPFRLRRFRASRRVLWLRRSAWAGPCPAARAGVI